MKKPMVLAGFVCLALCFVACGGSSSSGSSEVWQWETLTRDGIADASVSELSFKAHGTTLYLGYNQASEGKLVYLGLNDTQWSERARGDYADGNSHQKTIMQINNAGDVYIAGIFPVAPTGAIGSVFMNYTDQDNWEWPETVQNDVLNGAQRRDCLGFDWDNASNSAIFGYINTDVGETVMFAKRGSTAIPLLEEGEKNGVAIRYISSSEYYMLMRDSTANGNKAIIRYAGDGGSAPMVISEDAVDHIAIDAVGGKAYAAFVDSGAGNELTVIRDAANSDAASRVELGGRGFTSGTDSISYVSILPVSESLVYVLYLRDKNVFVEKWNGSRWERLDQVNDPVLNEASYPVMTLMNGTLHVAFNEYEHNGMGGYISGGATVRRWVKK